MILFKYDEEDTERLIDEIFEAANEE